MDHVDISTAIDLSPYYIGGEPPGGFLVRDWFCSPIDGPMSYILLRPVFRHGAMGGKWQELNKEG